MASTYLTRTPSSTGNRQTFTFSAWLKKATTDVDLGVFGEFENSSNRFRIKFRSDDKLQVDNSDSGSSTMSVICEAKLRDTSAWYHLVVAIDTTQSTASDRVKIYFNNVLQTVFQVATYPSQNSNTFISLLGHPMEVGRTTASNYWSGIMSHVHLTDGTAYDATAFGEYDANGVWTIKTSPSVTYGTNGFFILKDGNSGTDQSGNSNNFTVGGGTLTKTEDSPSNVFATLNPLHISDASGNYYLSLGNLRQHVTNNDGHRETGFTLHPKGLKGYFEVKCTVDPNFHLGLQNVTSPLVKTNYYTLASPNYYYMQASNPVKISYANSGSSATHIADYFSQISTGDIIGCAFDFTGTNKNVWFHKNGTYGNNGSGVGNPATGAYPAMTSTQLTADEYEFIVSPNTGSGNGQLDFNFGNGYFGTTAVASAGTNASGIGIFEYDVPTGFTALSTKGLNL